MRARRFIPACAGNRFSSRRLSGCQPVHPRVCGEQTHIKPGTANRDGSSPRVRGTDPVIPLAAVLSRFIPACAGNRIQGALDQATPAVHPRVCGEQGFIEAIGLKTSGSSPRVRGTVQVYAPGLGEIRFIPACAGNRPMETSSAITRTVHPRVCGEQTPAHREFAPVSGSSPRVRGTAVYDWHSQYCCRFIPACAGNRTRAE